MTTRQLKPGSADQEVDPMSTSGFNAVAPTGVRVSDADREAIAARLRHAAGEGRLTLAETDERLAGAYAARFAEDLDTLVRDLPPAADGRSDRGARPAS